MSYYYFSINSIIQKLVTKKMITSKLLRHLTVVPEMLSHIYKRSSAISALILVVLPPPPRSIHPKQKVPTSMLTDPWLLLQYNRRRIDVVAESSCPECRFRCCCWSDSYTPSARNEQLSMIGFRWYCLYLSTPLIAFHKHSTVDFLCQMMFIGCPKKLFHKDF